MSFQEYLPWIERAMQGLGCRRENISAEQAPFGNGSAEYSTEKIRILVALDRDHLQLDMKPLSGIASWRWYDAMAVLKKLERNGVTVHWAPNNQPASIEEFLRINLGLISDNFQRLQFSYIDGVTVVSTNSKKSGANPKTSGHDL